MAATGQRGVTAARRLRHQMLAAAPDQLAGLRRVTQRTQRQEERGVAGALPPTGQEQRHRIARQHHAEHADGKQAAEHHLEGASLLAELQQQEDEDADAGGYAGYRQPA